MYSQERSIIMQENKKSGPFCCGQNLNVIQLYQSISYLTLCLGLSSLFGNVAHAAICFLPDCGGELLEFQGDANVSTKYCRDNGYSYYELGQCPDYYFQEVCPENTHYLKCDAAKWCENNGYQISPDECAVPNYPQSQCPNGLNLYKQCKTDYQKACLEENPDYVNVCPSGWILDSAELCSYSPTYGKCCNQCLGYDYTSSNIPNGYVKGDSCQACGGIIKYQKVINPCNGYQRCSQGGKTGTPTCMHGTEKWYQECCSSCDGYPYAANSIPIGYIKGESCESCSGTKYKTKTGVCASGYVWSNNSCRQSCSVGNILNSDMSCSSSKISGKTPIGVVSYVSGNTRLAIQLEDDGEKYWSKNSVDISGIPNYSTDTKAKNDFNGKANTAAWVAYYGSGASSYAAGYCYNYSTRGTSRGQWYLPAAGELYASIWTNKTKVNSGLSAAGGDQLPTTDFHWSSSENTSNNAWMARANDIKVLPSAFGKTDNRFVRCMISF